MGKVIFYLDRTFPIIVKNIKSRKYIVLSIKQTRSKYRLVDRGINAKVQFSFRCTVVG